MKQLLLLLFFTCFLVKGYGQDETDSLSNSTATFYTSTTLDYKLVSSGAATLSVEQQNWFWGPWKQVDANLFSGTQTAGWHTLVYNTPSSLKNGWCRFKLVVIRNNTTTTTTFESYHTSDEQKQLSANRGIVNNVYRTTVNMNVLRIATAKGRQLRIVDTFQIMANPGNPIDYKIKDDDENGYIVIKILPKVSLGNTTTKAADNMTRATALAALYRDRLLLLNLKTAAKIDSLKTDSSSTRTLLTQTTDNIIRATALATLRRDSLLLLNPKTRAKIDSLKTDSSSNQTLLTQTKIIHNLHSIKTFQYKGDSLNPRNYLFAIKEDDLIPYARTPIRIKINASALALPFKLRVPVKGKNYYNLSTDFALSYCFGIRARLGRNPLRQNYITFIPIGGGLGDSKYTSKRDTNEVDVVSFTYCTGILFTIKKFNVGAFGGFDFMVGKHQDWIYQNQPWVSLGFGYKFGDD